MKKNKIQSLEIKESYFQQKQELGTFEAFVKSGFGGAGGTVIDMEKGDVKKIYDWYSRASKKGFAVKSSLDCNPFIFVLVSREWQ